MFYKLLVFLVTWIIRDQGVKYNYSVDNVQVPEMEHPEGYDQATPELVNRLFEDIRAIENWIRNEERTLVEVESRSLLPDCCHDEDYWGCGSCYIVLIRVRHRRQLLNAILKRHLELCTEFCQRDTTGNLSIILGLYCTWGFRPLCQVRLTKHPKYCKSMHVFCQPNLANYISFIGLSLWPLKQIVAKLGSQTYTLNSNDRMCLQN